MSRKIAMGGNQVDLQTEVPYSQVSVGPFLISCKKTQ